MIRLIYRSLLFLILVCLPYKELVAQIMVGPKVGFNLSSVDYRDRNYSQNLNFVPLPGFNAGAMASINVNKMFSLHTELFYSMEGKAIFGTGDSDLTSNISTYHFLRLPILFRATFSRPGTPVKAYVNIGPNISRWLGGSGRISADDLFEFYEEGAYNYRLRLKPGSPSENRVDKFLEEPIRWQLGMDFGGGFIYEMSKKHRLVLDFRYLYGHSFFGRDTDIDVSLSNYTENFQSSSQVFSISVGYLYDIDLYAWAKGKSTSKVK